MACGPKGKCEQAYRKPGKNSVHCKIQTANGGKWDFCAHQYFCPNSNRWELNAEANKCPMTESKTTKKNAARKKKTAKKKKADPETATADEPVKTAADD